MTKHTRLFLYCAFFLLVSSWLYLKINLFHGFAYDGDLFPNIQISASYLDGFPIMANNFYCREGQCHNNFLELAFASFSWRYGAYALFAFSFILTLLAGLRVLSLLKLTSKYQSRILIVIFACNIIGPIGFYIFDLPRGGWNPDNLYFPLGLLFAASLASFTKRQSEASTRNLWIVESTLYGLMLVLIKEDGAIIANAIHLAWLFSRYQADSNSSKGFLVRVWQEKSVFLKTVFFWMTIFFIGLLRVTLDGNPQDSRFLQTFEQLRKTFSELEFQRAAALSLVQMIFLTGLGLLPILALREKPRVTWLLIVLLPPLSVIGFGCVAHYEFGGFNMLQFGVLWSSRMAGFWSICTAILLFQAIQQSQASSEKGSLKASVPPLLVVSISFLIQGVLLSSFQNYHILDRIWISRSSEHVQKSMTGLSPTEIDFLHCLAKSLPAHSFVLAEPRYHAAFHKHYLMPPYDTDQALKPAQLLICDSASRVPDLGCLALMNIPDRENWAEERLEGLTMSSSEPIILAGLRSCK